jgi:hypothetical protein
MLYVYEMETGKQSLKENDARRIETVLGEISSRNYSPRLRKRGVRH